MKMMKKLERMFLIVLLFSAANAHAATGYTPLVHIPGLSEGGVIDISSYLVGIYIFALSIVGIVAVFYLILGGMKYITAAGNPGKAGDAKSTIEGAIGGLLLALLSWVIINAINPDILYLRQPGAFLKGIDTQMDKLVDCAQSEHNTGTDCVCKDGYEPDNVPTTDKTCNEQCYAEQRCVETHACIAAGSPYDANDPSYSAVEGCTCADGTKLTLPAEGNCSKTCKDAGKCGSKFLAIKLNMNHEKLTDGEYMTEPNDALWDFTLTNNGNYGDFNVTGSYFQEDKSYNCALLIQNEVTNGGDLHWIFWVKDGSRITRTGGTLLSQLNGRMQDCCNEENRGDCGMDFILWGGDCDRAAAIKILDTKFGDDVQDSCKNCDFAEWAGSEVHFRPARDVKCVGGFWQ